MARYNLSVASESRLPIIIFGIIVAIIALPFLIDLLRESRRPVLVEARVVTATSADPVFRDGRRRVPAGYRVEAALALRFERAGRHDQWLSPAAHLEIGGAAVEHIQSSDWPDPERSLRVFWFSVECANLGGKLTADSAAERLRYRTFLAPEMGRKLLALQLPELHFDDHIGESGTSSIDGGGTRRLYARVEIVEEAKDVRPLQAVTTMGAERILESDFPTVLRGANLGEGIHPSAGELFGLPGFEAEGETSAERNGVPMAAFGLTFNELVARRVVVSSWTFAASAISGGAELEPSDLQDLGEVTIKDERVEMGNRPVAWGEGVRSGDLLADGSHWLVLLADNGNGLLDPADSVAHSWGRPPERTTLFAAAGSDVILQHFRQLP